MYALKERRLLQDYMYQSRLSGIYCVIQYHAYVGEGLGAPPPSQQLCGHHMLMPPFWHNLRKNIGGIYS